MKEENFAEAATPLAELAMNTSLPPGRALLKGAMWCGIVWGVGYGSYLLTLGQMDKNLKTVRADIGLTSPSRNYQPLSFFTDALHCDMATVEG